MIPETTSVQTLVIWALALTAIINFGTNLWTIFSGPSRRNAVSLAEHAALLSRIEARVQSVELHQGALPTMEVVHKSAEATKQVMHQLELALSDVRGDIREMKAVMDGNTKIMARVENIVARHDDHLLDGKK